MTVNLACYQFVQRNIWLVQKVSYNDEFVAWYHCVNHLEYKRFKITQTIRFLGALYLVYMCVCVHMHIMLIISSRSKHIIHNQQNVVKSFYRLSSGINSPIINGNSLAKLVHPISAAKYCHQNISHASINASKCMQVKMYHMHWFYFIDTSYSTWISELLCISTETVSLNDIMVQHIVLCECLEKDVMCIAPMCDDLTVHRACRKR